MIRFNHKGDLIATGSMDSTVKIWNFEGKLLHTLEGPSDEITCIDWHSKGNALLTASADGSIWMWNG